MIKEVKAKSIVTKTQLPEGDFVINPYTGCAHGCKYCYARFMKRFTGHKEPWGSFVDAKTNAPELVTRELRKCKGKSVTIGSVTDPYQLIEEKYKLTRQILEKLLLVQPRLDILTKSDLVTRDIDLLKKFDDCIVAISLSMLNERLRKKLEPAAPSASRRFSALKRLHKAGIQTALFISPIFPELTDWKEMVTKTRDFVDEYWFENLNLYPSISHNIYSFLKENEPKLVDNYKQIYPGRSSYWHEVENEIASFCKREGVKYTIYFHHKIKRKP